MMAKKDSKVWIAVIPALIALLSPIIVWLLGTYFTPSRQAPMIPTPHDSIKRSAAAEAQGALDSVDDRSTRHSADHQGDDHPAKPPGDRVTASKAVNELLVKIVEKATNKPISGVHFSVVETGQEGLSDGDGWIKIDLTRFSSTTSTEEFPIDLHKAGYIDQKLSISATAHGQKLVLIKDEKTTN